MRQNIRIFLLVLLLNSFSIYSQKDTTRQNDSLQLFAKLENSVIKIVADTTYYKTYLAKKMFPDKNIVFRKTEIRKQKALGSGKDIYIPYMESGDSIRVARYILKKGNNLFLNNVENEDGDLFEQICIACFGDEECSPEVYIDKKQRMWGCSKTLICPATDDDSVPKCYGQQVFIPES